MKILVWDADGKLVLTGQVTRHSGFPAYVTSVDGVLKVRYSNSGQSVEVPPATIGAHWKELAVLKPQAGDWPEDFEYENGQYQSICSICSKAFIGHKRRMVCKVCFDEHRKQPLSDPGKLPASVTINGVEYIPKPDVSKIPTLRSWKLYELFQEFRHAKVTVHGMGDSFNRATEHLDNEVRDIVAKLLKGT